MLPRRPPLGKTGPPGRGAVLKMRSKKKGKLKRRPKLKKKTRTQAKAPAPPETTSVLASQAALLPQKKASRSSTKKKMKRTAFKKEGLSAKARSRSVPMRAVQRKVTLRRPVKRAKTPPPAPAVAAAVTMPALPKKALPAPKKVPTKIEELPKVPLTQREKRLLAAREAAARVRARAAKRQAEWARRLQKRTQTGIDWTRTHVPPVLKEGASHLPFERLRASLPDSIRPREPPFPLRGARSRLLIALRDEQWLMKRLKKTQRQEYRKRILILLLVTLILAIAIFALVFWVDNAVRRLRSRELGKGDVEIECVAANSDGTLGDTAVTRAPPNADMVCQLRTTKSVSATAFGDPAIRLEPPSVVEPASRVNDTFFRVSIQTALSPGEQTATPLIRGREEVVEADASATWQVTTQISPDEATLTCRGFGGGERSIARGERVRCVFDTIQDASVSDFAVPPVSMRVNERTMQLTITQAPAVRQVTSLTSSTGDAATDGCIFPFTVVDENRRFLFNNTCSDRIIGEPWCPTQVPFPRVRLANGSVVEGQFDGLIGRIRFCRPPSTEAGMPCVASFRIGSAVIRGCTTLGNPPVTGSTDSNSSEQSPWCVIDPALNGKEFSVDDRRDESLRNQKWSFCVGRRFETVLRDLPLNTSDIASTVSGSMTPSQSMSMAVAMQVAGVDFDLTGRLSFGRAPLSQPAQQLTVVPRVPLQPDQVRIRCLGEQTQSPLVDLGGTVICFLVTAIPASADAFSGAEVRFISETGDVRMQVTDVSKIEGELGAFSFKFRALAPRLKGLLFITARLRGDGMTTTTTAPTPGSNATVSGTRLAQADFVVSVQALPIRADELTWSCGSLDYSRMFDAVAAATLFCLVDTARPATLEDFAPVVGSADAVSSDFVRSMPEVLAADFVSELQRSVLQAAFDAKQWSFSIPLLFGALRTVSLETKNAETGAGFLAVRPLLQRASAADAVPPRAPLLLPVIACPSSGDPRCPGLFDLQLDNASSAEIGADVSQSGMQASVASLFLTDADGRRQARFIQSAVFAVDLGAAVTTLDLGVPVTGNASGLVLSPQSKIPPSTTLLRFLGERLPWFSLQPIQLAPDFFANTRSLRSVTLSNNDFSGNALLTPQGGGLPRDLLSEHRDLRVFRCNNCMLRSLTDDLFRVTTKLQVIELRNNALQFVAPALAAAQAELRVLDLRDNRLTELDAQIAAIDTLEELRLSGNTFRCRPMWFDTIQSNLRVFELPSFLSQPPPPCQQLGTVPRPVDFNVTGSAGEIDLNPGELDTIQDPNTTFAINTTTPAPTPPEISTFIFSSV
ncbi:MAG: hypothetical protein MHM6MM_002508 [Cercozoa sp. M6MM]